MKIRELISKLNEGISKILYHVTNINNLENILKDNKFRLTPDLGSESDSAHRKTDKKVYYFSTARNKLGSYGLSVGNGSTTLVINGEKLSNTYSGKAVDYWGEEFRKINPSKFESEDRIYSDKRHIENAKQYILEIHIYMDVEQFDDRTAVIKTWKRTIILLKQKNIPYWIYDNKNYYLTQNKNKSIELPLNLLKADNKEDLQRPAYYRHRRRHLDRWLELYYKKSENELSPEARKLSGLLYSDFYKQDMLSSLSADFSNNKNNPDSGVDTLIDIIRKENLRDLRGFVDFLANKWSKQN